MMETIQQTTELGEHFQLLVTGPRFAARGILIIHDFWGVKPYNLAWAKRFAELGYRAAVVDLYDGRHPQDHEQATVMMRAMDQQCANRKLRQALGYLKAPERRLATLGWAFGGLQSQQATLQDPTAVSATVFFYSRVITDPKVLGALCGPVLGIYSETEGSWPAKQRDFESAMDAAGRDTESASFTADHGFVDPESPHYDADTTRAAWEATRKFLARHLG
jgi:carboxymethylenebutenolidase